MGLLGGDDEKPDEVRSLVEDARHDSVTLKRLTEVKPGTLRRYLNDKPLVEYLRKGEQPHFVLAARMKEPRAEGTGLPEMPEQTGTGMVMHMITDQRWLAVASNTSGDQTLSVPLEDVASVTCHPGGTRPHRIDLKVDGGTIEIPIANIYDDADVEAAVSFIGTATSNVEMEGTESGSVPGVTDAVEVNDDIDAQTEEPGADDVTEAEKADRDELTDISGVGIAEAQQLREAGYETVETIRGASQDELANVEGVGMALAARIKADVGDLDVSESVDSEGVDRSPDALEAAARGNIKGDELTATGGKVFKVGYFSTPVVNRLRHDETVHYVLRNFVDGLNLNGTEHEPGSNRRAVACVTDQRLLFVIGGKWTDRRDSDMVVDVEHDDIVSVECEDRSLVVRGIRSETDIATLRFPVKNDGQIDDAVTYVSDQTGGSALDSLRDRIETLVEEATEAESDGRFDEAIEMLEKAMSANERYDRIVEEITVSAEPPVSGDEIRNHKAETQQRKWRATYQTHVEEGDRHASQVPSGSSDSIEALQDAYDSAIEAYERALSVAEQRGVGDEQGVQNRLGELREEKWQRTYKYHERTGDDLLAAAENEIEADSTAGAGALQDAFDDAIEAYERALSVAEEHGVGNAREIQERLEELREQKWQRTYEYHERTGDDLLAAAEDTVETDSAAGIDAFDDAIEAYERALSVVEEHGVGDAQSLRKRVEEVRTRRDDRKISSLGSRIAAVEMPKADEEGLDDAVTELESLLDETESTDVDREKDLALVYDEAAKKLTEARVKRARRQARAALDQFRANEYRDAQESFAALTERLDSIDSEIADSDVTDHAEELDRLLDACRENGERARRAALGLEDDVEPVPVEPPADDDGTSGRTDGRDRAGATSRGDPGTSAAETGRNRASAASTSPVLDGVALAYDDIEKGTQIGSGGNADVYRGTVRVDGHESTIALKEPRMQGTLHANVLEQFMSEAETWSKLDDHGHIVSVLGYGSSPIPWIALDYMDVGDLNRNRDRLDRASRFRTAIDVTDAVWHAHQRGVAHLDLKPANILFASSPDVDPGVVKIADWGLAKMLLDHSKSVEGLSPRYSAPEQFDSSTHGSPDNRTDVFQLGTILYELFAGVHPFEGRPSEVMHAILTESPAPPSTHNEHIPDELDEAVLTALTKDKTDRYQAVVNLRDDIERIAP